MGRTLLSDAFDFDFLFLKVKIKVKGVGQECPTHTSMNFIRANLPTTKAGIERFRFFYAMKSCAAGTDTGSGNRSVTSAKAANFAANSGVSDPG
jgi:hypothetical protein